MKNILSGMAAALAVAAVAAEPNFPLGTYVYAGTAMNFRNEVLTRLDGMNIQAVADDGTVLATAPVVDTPSDSGVNFRLEVPVSSRASGKSAAIGDAPRCVIVTSAGSRGAATERFPPILSASAVTNCIVVWAEAATFTNAETSAVAVVPQEYLDNIAPLMDGHPVYEPWADWDGDGANNYAEYTAGTNPFDPSDYLRITGFAATPAVALISFEYVGGHLYALQSAKSLSNPKWATTEFKTSENGKGQKALYAAGALRLRIVDLGLVPRRALQLLQLCLLPSDDRVVVRGDLTAQRGEILLRGVAAAERDKPLRLLVELRALLLHGRAEPVHARLAVPPTLLFERCQAQIRGYADNDCLVHGHVPFLFTEASLPLTSQERNRA